MIVVIPQMYMNDFPDPYLSHSVCEIDDPTPAGWYNPVSDINKVWQQSDSPRRAAACCLSLKSRWLGVSPAQVF